MNRVVITGIGTVSPIGNDVPSFWESMRQDKSGVSKITRFDASNTGISVAAEVKDFDPSLTMDRKEYKRMDLFSQYGVAAAAEALAMSGYAIEENPYRVGTLVSSGIGGLIEIENGIRKMIDKGPKRIPPLFVPMTIGNMGAGNISMKFGAKGISLDIVTACASATNSIGEAFLKIKNGLLDACFAGGAEGTINEIGIGGFAALTALSTNEDPTKASRPFDKDRDGFVMGEGAGILFLESLESAQKRQATILGEVVGYGSNSDAYHMTAPLPDGSGAGEAMKAAVEMAGIKVEDVDYINAHGTSTPTNDSAETVAIKYAFGEQAYNVPISSSKGHFGHLLGAAGGVEAVAVVKALQEGFIPATLGLENPDENCDLDYVPAKGRKQDIRYALSNSLGFGGHNAVLCFKRWDGE
ncbi:beta-ketoacyl-ACP synthase II [Fundicoccus culcitae]|uniref:3-oxoacyl-[acyl-carrier-protein] synthase 2 n=1 Tax=Fundicoccus culcitae TaxID=2969821 RepID=A0ABY5P696_9LACT|nr:beta-ketoacyl-ACP synthase II [Fundicoccus culcitae]UUX34267.1 beta-ketoacyl-ACP synthase II [Fundicoccus culcitae]